MGRHGYSTSSRSRSRSRHGSSTSGHGRHSRGRGRHARGHDSDSDPGDFDEGADSGKVAYGDWTTVGERSGDSWATFIILMVYSLPHLVFFAIAFIDSASSNSEVLGDYQDKKTVEKWFIFYVVMCAVAFALLILTAVFRMGSCKKMASGYFKPVALYYLLMFVFCMIQTLVVNSIDNQAAPDWGYYKNTKYTFTVMSGVTLPYMFAGLFRSFNPEPFIADLSDDAESGMAAAGMVSDSDEDSDY